MLLFGAVRFVRIDVAAGRAAGPMAAFRRGCLLTLSATTGRPGITKIAGPVTGLEVQPT